MSENPIREILASPEALGDDPALAEASAALFDYVQFLLDDDGNLTPAGNLTGKAREKLRDRLMELLPDPSADPGPEAAGEGDLLEDGGSPQ